MPKSREHVITNGRATFYAALWDDFRQAALRKGWALGLHSSMASDLDIMAMPWTEDAKPATEMIKALENCLTEPDKKLWASTQRNIDKPNNRYLQIFCRNKLPIDGHPFELDVSSLIKDKEDYQRLYHYHKRIKSILDNRENILKTIAIIVL